MRVATPAGVHVDMDQLRNAEVVDGAREADLETGLLTTLAQRSIPRGLAGIDVTARLQPDPEPLVFEQYHSPRSDHDAGSGHVDDVDGLIERSLQSVERNQERRDGVDLTLIDRHPGNHVRPDTPVEFVLLLRHGTGVAVGPRMTRV